MPGPFIARRVGGRLFVGFVGPGQGEDVTCPRCGAVARDLPLGCIAEQWALDHLVKVHPAIYATEDLDLRRLFAFVTAAPAR